MRKRGVSGWTVWDCQNHPVKRARRVRALERGGLGNGGYFLANCEYWLAMTRYSLTWSL